MFRALNRKWQICMVSFFLSFLIPAFSADFVQKCYRDVFSTHQFSLSDEASLGFLDGLIIRQFASSDDYARILQILRTTYSSEVVCQVFSAVSVLKNVPAPVIDEILKFANSNCGIPFSLATRLGELGIPRTFPVLLIIHLTSCLSPVTTCDNALLGFYRFGIESIAGLPFILPRYQLPNGGHNMLSNFVNYFYKLPIYFLEVTLIGQGIIVPYSPQLLPEDRHMADPAKPILSELKKMLSDLRKAPKYKRNVVHVKYDNFELPKGKLDYYDSDFCCGPSSSLSQTIWLLFGLIDVQVEFREKMDEGFQYESHGKSYGQMLDEIFFKNRLKGVLRGDKIFIFRNNQE